MQKTTRKLVLAFIAGTVFSACADNDGPAENLGERIDDAVSEARDRLEDARDEAEDAAEDIGDALQGE